MLSIQTRNKLEPSRARSETHSIRLKEGTSFSSLLKETQKKALSQTCTDFCEWSCSRRLCLPTYRILSNHPHGREESFVENSTQEALSFRDRQPMSIYLTLGWPSGVTGQAKSVHCEGIRYKLGHIAGFK